MVNESEIHHEVLKRWHRSKQRYAELYPEDPEPFLTDGYRSIERQNELYAQGRTKEGKIVTKAKGGESVHNYLPSCAFDIAFKRDGHLDWRESLFRKFAVIAKDEGLEWGGDWKFKDMPHFQAPKYTYHDAERGMSPVFPDKTDVGIKIIDKFKAII